MTNTGRVASVAILASVAAGAAVAWLSPAQGAAITAAAAGGVLVLALVGYGYRPFWYSLLALVLGYVLLGKGFAYAGTGVVHVGEGVLALAAGSVAVAAARGRLGASLRRLPGEVWLLAAFLVWQAARTLPFIQFHGIEALRDGALWGYAGFALAILLVVPRAAVDTALHAGARLAPWLLAALLAVFLAGKLGFLTVALPGAPVPLGMLKGGDVGVHLGGLGGLLLLAPVARGQAGEPRQSIVPWLIWWSCSFVLASGSRAAALAAAAGVGIALWFSTGQRWRPLAAAALVVVGAATLFELRAPGRRGEISARQVAASLASIVTNRTGEGGPVLRQESKEWRLRWWEDVVGYTVNGPYRWTGKGYGISLAEDDGYLVGDRTVRSPHNVFVTILARSGVPGLVSWLAFLALLLGRVLRRALARSACPEDRKFAAWALAYLVAFLVNASFDVFLEGPMGGIPFWSLIGVCLVKTRDAGDEAEPEWRKVA